MTMRTMADFERVIRVLDITVVQVSVLSSENGGSARLVRVGD
jgi:hypothetical protein